MTELEEILARLGLSQYLGRLIDEGFEKWETVLDITEQDLAALNFKLGHRRTLQREIASARGVPLGQPLVYQQFSPAEEPFDPEDKASPPFKVEDPNKIGPTGKRKYRRHPKPDEHAPEKPPSAYVMFANHVRDELKGQPLSFTDIAKLVGERWKALDSDHKEEFEFAASLAKSKYNTELSEYKKTDSYKDYLQYLSEFRARTTKEGSGKKRPSSAYHSKANSPSTIESAERKRPKLEGLPVGSAGSSSSAGTSTTASSCGSAGGGITTTTGAFNTPRPATGTSVGRVGSISSTTNTNSFPSPSSQSPLTHSSALPTQQKPTVSPTSSPTPSINRYGDALVKTSQEQQLESLTSLSGPPGHDLDSITLPRIHSTTSQNPHIQQQLSYSRHQPPPPPTSGPSAYSRSSGLPPVQQGQSMRRPGEEMGNTSAPPMPPLDDNRGSRALPLPAPGPPHGSHMGYFDQRPPHHHLSPSRSPRQHNYPQLPGPTQLVHSSSYPHPSSRVSTPQPESNGSSASSGTIPVAGPVSNLNPRHPSS
ncbi:hypothetical protein EV426DRAFT_633299 [Tirmania nivea]|nr:hypothetical protein EV426DRAFT_633299 [Tirmania nivea]